jgi:hypothetical protein
VVRINPIRIWELNSSHQQILMSVESIHITGCSPVLQKGRLQLCYHHFSGHAAFGTMPHTLASVDQNPVYVLGRYTPTRRGRLGLDFRGMHSIT